MSYNTGEHIKQMSKNIHLDILNKRGSRFLRF